MNGLLCSEKMKTHARFRKKKTINVKDSYKKISSNSREEKEPLWKYKVFGVPVVAIVACCLLIGYLSIPSATPVPRVRKAAANKDILDTLAKQSGTLARVMNTITLQTELLSGKVTMKQVFAELFGIQDPKLVVSISKKNIEGAVAGMNKLYEIGGAAIDGIGKSLEKLKSIEKSVTLPDAPSKNISELFMPFKNTTKGIEEPLATSEISKNIQDVNTLHAQLDIETPDLTVFKSKILSVVSSMSDFETTQFPRIKTLQDTLKNISGSTASLKSIAKVMDEYERIVNNSFGEFKSHLMGLIVPAGKYDEWASKSEIGSVKNLLESLQKLLAPLETENLLIGIPNGSKDLEDHLNDLTDKWLTKMLNKGKYLDTLKDILGSIMSLKDELKKLEEIWSRQSRERGAKNVRNSLQALKIAETMKSSSGSITKSTNFIIDAINNLTAANGFDSGSFAQMKKFINSTSKVDLFREKVDGLVAYVESQSLSFAEINGYQYAVTQLSTDNEKLTNFTTDPLPRKYFESIKNITSQLDALNSSKVEVVSAVTALLPYESTITDDVISSASKSVKIPSTMKKDIEKVEQFVKLLETLSTNRRKKRENLDSLKDMLLKGKAQFDGADKLGETFKKNAGDKWKRLESFKESREVTNQVAYNQRTLELYKNSTLESAIQDLIQKVQNLKQKPKEWKNYAELEAALKRLPAAITALVPKIPKDSDNLKSFGKQLATFDELSLPSVNFVSMRTSLQNLNDSSSPEVVAVAESLRRLEGLQYASMRKKGTIVSSMEKTDAFFAELFGGTEEDEFPWTIVIGVVIFFVVASIIAAVVLLVLWKKRKSAEKMSSTESNGSATQDTQPLLPQRQDDVRERKPVAKPVEEKKQEKEPGKVKDSKVAKPKGKKKAKGKKRRTSQKSSSTSSSSSDSSPSSSPKLITKKNWKYSPDGVLRGINLQRYMNYKHQVQSKTVEGRMGKLRWRHKRVTRHPPIIDVMPKNWESWEPTKFSLVKRNPVATARPSGAPRAKAGEDPLSDESNPPKPAETVQPPVEPPPTADIPKPVESTPPPLEALPASPAPADTVPQPLETPPKPVSPTPVKPADRQLGVRTDPPPGPPRVATSAAKAHQPGFKAPRFARKKSPTPKSDEKVRHPNRADRVWVPYAAPKINYDRYNSDDLRSINTITLSTQSDDSSWIYDASTQMSFFSEVDSLSDLDDVFAPDEVNRQRHKLREAELADRHKKRIIRKKKKLRKRTKKSVAKRRRREKKAKKARTSKTMDMLAKRRLRRKNKRAPKKNVADVNDLLSTTDEENLLVKIRRTNPKLYDLRMMDGVDIKEEQMMIAYESHSSDGSDLDNLQRMWIDTRMEDWLALNKRQLAVRLEEVEQEKEEEKKERAKAIEKRLAWEKQFEPIEKQIEKQRKEFQKMDTMFKANQEIELARYEEEKARRTPDQMVAEYLRTSFEPDPEVERQIVELAYLSILPIENYISARNQDRWEHLYRSECAEFSHDWCRVRMTKDFVHECDFYDAAWVFPSGNTFELTYEKYTNKLIASCSPMFQESVPILWHWLWENDVEFLVVLNKYEECNLYRTLHWFPTKPGHKYKFGRNKYREYHITCVSSEKVNKGTERKFIFEFIYGGLKMPPRQFTILRMKSWPKHQVPYVWEPYADLCERIKPLSVDRPVVVMSVSGNGRACTLIMALQAALMVGFDDDISVHNMVSSARESKRIACTDEGQSYVWRMIHYELIFRWYPEVSKPYVTNPYFKFRNGVYYKYATDFNKNEKKEMINWLYKDMNEVQRNRVTHYEYFLDYHRWWNMERYLYRYFDNERKDNYVARCFTMDPPNEMGHTRYAPTVRRKPLRAGDPPRKRNKTCHILDLTQDERDPRDAAIKKQKRWLKKLKAKRKEQRQEKREKLLKERKSEATDKVVSFKISAAELKKMKLKRKQRKIKKKKWWMLKHAPKGHFQKMREEWLIEKIGASTTHCFYSRTSEFQFFTLYYDRQYPKNNFDGHELVNGGFVWIKRKYRPFVKQQLKKGRVPRIPIIRSVPRYGPLCRRMLEQRKGLRLWRKYRREVKRRRLERKKKAGELKKKKTAESKNQKKVVSKNQKEAESKNQKKAESKNQKKANSKNQNKNLVK